MVKKIFNYRNIQIAIGIIIVLIIIINSVINAMEESEADKIFSNFIENYKDFSENLFISGLGYEDDYYNDVSYMVSDFPGFADFILNIIAVQNKF